jgi:hypothetical protein
MKLTKTASGKTKIKMSKKEWVTAGRKAGWLTQKEAGLFGPSKKEIAREERATKNLQQKHKNEMFDSMMGEDSGYNEQSGGFNGRVPEFEYDREEVTKRRNGNWGEEFQETERTFGGKMKQLYQSWQNILGNYARGFEAVLDVADFRGSIKEYEREHKEQGGAVDIPYKFKDEVDKELGKRIGAFVNNSVNLLDPRRMIKQEKDGTKLPPVETIFNSLDQRLRNYLKHAPYDFREDYVKDLIRKHPKFEEYSYTLDSYSGQGAYEHGVDRQNL